mgnify:CR=1 FL=1
MIVISMTVIVIMIVLTYENETRMKVNLLE